MELEFLGMPAIIRSEPMLALLEFIKKVAQTSAAVLITGESGSGKELVARALHQYSLRCTKPWIDINCASIPEHLIESELFGFEKGAFSGADFVKQGLFELAHTGTLFMDEVGELEARTQVKLLRVLDGASYYRLGGLRKVSADVRIVAATNKNLEQEVDKGQFRPDLYHRLSQLEIRVPPLRERPEDAAAIAEHFLHEQDARCCFSRDALEFIQSYSWPGNVRELRNAVIRAVLQAAGPEIHACDLHPAPVAMTGRDLNLDAMESRMITEALASTGGHQQKAADLLGISQRTLSRKLKRIRIQPLAAGQSMAGFDGKLNPPTHGMGRRVSGEKCGGSAPARMAV